jgi:4-hydroxyphenylpyruvate dioxygenase
MATSDLNPIGILGVDFVEYTGPASFSFESLFKRMGFTQTAKSEAGSLQLFQQGKIKFILNNEKSSFAENFAKAHGPAICSMAFKVQNAELAFKSAVAKGAKAYEGKEGKKLVNMPAVYGIGDSLIYFMDEQNKAEVYEKIFNLKFPLSEPKGFGMINVDHFTNNVPKGDMEKWCNFYADIFNFKNVRYFDIKGKQTGLQSKVMKSPCGTFCIPINEPTEGKSQIQEYLDEYKGSGIQHLALTTDNILTTLESSKSQNLEYLTPPPKSYYEMLKDRLPIVTEEVNKLESNAVLVDGDHDGYLLQIFTKNVIGPIFYEIIQRKNHFGFGEGNFQALFDAIERDQQLRGYL